MDCDLKNILDNMKSPFWLEEIECIIVQLLSAIEFLHSKWYIQWDLKISNILYKEARIYIDNLGYILFYGELLLEIIN